MARVLLIDDDIAEISAVKRVLSRGGHQPVLATSIADALTLAEQERPAAAVVSAACENGGGAGVALRLLEHPGTPQLPVLVLGEEKEVPRGAIRIPRPLDPSQLERELGLALEPKTAAPPARIPIQALSGGSPAVNRSAASARSAAEALLQRADEMRRERAEPGPGAATEAEERVPPEAPSEGASVSELPRAPATEEERLVAEIDAELDRLIRDAPEEGRPAEPGLAADDAADQVARRANAEAERRRAEEAAERLAAEARRAEQEAVHRRERDRAERAEGAPAREGSARRGEEGAPLSPAGPGAPGPPPPLSRSDSLAPSEPLPAPADPSAARAPKAEAEVQPEASPELPLPPAELAAGTLAEAPMPRLLALASRNQLTGRLDFGSAPPRSVYFEDGRVVGATSAAPAERVEDVALRLGLVTRDQHRQASTATANLSSRRSALLLLERGFLKPEELTPLVRRRTEEVIFSLFGEVAAPFRYLPALVPPEERTALGRGPLELALEGVRRKWLEPRIGSVLGGPSTLLAPAPRAPTPAELGLSSSEARAAALADGLRTLDEILADSPLEPAPCRQLLAGLVMVGALGFRFQGGSRREANARAIDLARLRDKLDQVRRSDYFTILGVPRDGTPYEVREAAERLLAEFDPDRFQGLREPGLKEKLDEVRRVVGEAREVLSDEALRGEYVEALGVG